jgi:tetratricopeptide (TPR) repeat protein
MDSRQVIARFEAERQALALMDHANIARVLDAGTTSAGKPYFVMDLVKGVPITRYCDEHHLTPRQRLELFIPVCQALQHAHQKGIIHRDLKPSNVLVADYDGKPVPKIIDFGVAKATGQQLTDKTLVTGFGAIVGTLEYMSPEQAEVKQLDIDTRSDIYSLGVLLYELLTGSTPFSQKTLTQAGMLEMLRVIREKEPSKPSTKLSTAEGLPTLAANRGTEPARLRKLVRGELDWIVMKALEKDRDRRYETANGFAMDVQRYLADEPVQACPPSAGYRLSKFARRNKGVLAVSALVLFFLTLLVSGAGWVVRDRSARETELRQAVTAALDKVTDLRQRGRWGEARAVLEQARQRLGPSGEADLRRQVEQAESDLALVDRLEAARLEASAIVGSHLDYVSAARECAAAFRDAGIGQETEAPEVVADRIRSSAVREQLVAAVDDWALWVGNVPAREWLLAVARAADPDPWRDRFRDAAVWQDRRALERLAREAKPNELSPRVLSSLISTLLSQGADAAPLLVEARRRYPGDFWLNFRLGWALGRAGRWAEAVVYCQTAMALRPAASGVRNNLGVALRGTGRMDEAIAEFRKAIELDPKNAEVHNNIGFTLRATGRVDEAIAEHRKATELDPKEVEYRHRLGQALREKGWVDDAIPQYRMAIELDPKHRLAHKDLAIALGEKGRGDDAIAEWKKIVELDPKYVDAHKDLAGVLGTTGHADEAIAELKILLELDPEHLNAHKDLAVALGKTGRVDEAIAEWKKIVERHPTQVEVHRTLAHALRAKGRLDEAIAEWKKVVELDPNNVDTHNQLGSSLRDKGRVDEAIAEHRKAVELEPRDLDSHNHLGYSLWAEGRVDEAIAEYRKAIELNARYVFAHLNLGVALWDEGRVDEAIAELTKATELEPNFGGPHYHLGIALRDKGCVNEAIAELKKVDELEPNFAWPHYHLGIALRDEGRVDEAIALFEERIQRKPDWHEPHFGLASALAGAKQWDRSASVYATALKRFGADLWPGPWSEAIRSDEVFTRLTAHQPDDRLPRIMRARLHVFDRDWKRAAEDYADIYKSLANLEPAHLLPEGGDDLMISGCVLLLLGDRPGYDQLCKQWAERVGDSPTWGFFLARTWAVIPSPIVPAQQIVDLVEKILPADRAAWQVHILSLAHYRNGEFERAIELALESNGAWSGTVKALNWVVLAMAHSRLGHATDARKYLKQALELGGRASEFQLARVKWSAIAVPDFVEFELLRREAEELINSKSKEKLDKKSG